MQNHMVPAAAEGMPTTISRRAFLRSTASAAIVGGACVMHAHSPAASAGLLAALADHVQATKEWMACLSVHSVMEDRCMGELRRMEAAGVDRAEIDRTREAFKADPEIITVDDAVDEASAREHAALAAVFEFPVATTADLRAKLEHLQAMPDRDESFGMIDNPVTTLMRSITGGGRA